MGVAVSREAQSNVDKLRELARGALRAKGVRSWKYSVDDVNDSKRQRVE